MKIGLIENAWWDSPVDPISGIKLTKEIGFDTYDLYPLKGVSARSRREMREALAKAGLPCYAIIAAAFSLTDLNAETRKFTVDWARRQLDFGYDLGCKVMVLVPGEYALEKQEIEPKVQWNWAAEGVREVADHAKNLGMGLALEFLAHKYALLNSVGEMVRFLNDVNHPSVKANIDISHLYLNGDPPESLEKLRNKVAGVHFSDCNGKVHGDLPPGRGTVPLRDYLQGLHRIGYSEPVSVELEWCREPAKIREWVTEAFDATARIMTSLNLRS